MIIRNESADDIPAIRRVICAAFDQSAEADLVDSLRDCGAIAFSLVAQDQTGIVGHVLYSRFQVPQHCLALAPVSVAPQCQNTGIGSKLIREGLARARQENWQAVFVLGEPDYYQRFGFSARMADKFDTPYPKPYFMALELVPDALKQCSGEIIYAEPFLALEEN